MAEQQQDTHTGGAVSGAGLAHVFQTADGIAPAKSPPAPSRPRSTPSERVRVVAVPFCREALGPSPVSAGVALSPSVSIYACFGIHLHLAPDAHLHCPAQASFTAAANAR